MCVICQSYIHQSPSNIEIIVWAMIVVNLFLLRWSLSIQSFSSRNMSEPEKLRKFLEGTIVKTVSEEIKTEKKVASFITFSGTFTYRSMRRSAGGCFQRKTVANRRRKRRPEWSSSSSDLLMGNLWPVLLSCAEQYILHACKMKHIYCFRNSGYLVPNCSLCQIFRGAKFSGVPICPQYKLSRSQIFL